MIQKRLLVPWFYVPTRVTTAYTPIAIDQAGNAYAAFVDCISTRN
jgi:hypothetical protein